MNRIIRLITLVAAFGLLALDSAEVSAQTTYTACRIPDVGAIYMIGVSGAPTDCLDPSHVEFSWTEGGALGTGSVTSDVILDGTIATVDIAADAVTSAEIADGSVGPADVSAALAPLGVEFLPGTVPFDPTTAEATAASIQLTHPASGYIVASASAQIICSTERRIRLGIANGTTDVVGNYYNVGTIDWTHVFAHEVIPVSGSATANLNFNVQVIGTDDCSGMSTLNFMAIWVPNRY